MFRRRQTDLAATPRSDAGYDAPAGRARGVGPYGLTRAAMTLLGAGGAGLLIWFATQLNHRHEAGYWGIIGLMAAAGLVIALSQLLGGWTKWGGPRISLPVFAVAFLPALVAGLWVLLYNDPSASWLPRHVRNWSDDIGIDRLVAELGVAQAAVGFGLGLVFGLTFDTTG